MLLSIFSCACKQCKNPNGINSCISTSTESKTRRKRDWTGNLKRNRNRSLYEELDVDISEPRWSKMERYLLFCIMKSIESNSKYCTHKLIFDVYCKMLTYFKTNVRSKSLGQIRSKIKHLESLNNPYGE